MNNANKIKNNIRSLKVKSCGFTLIELIIFILVLGILASGLLGSYMATLRSTPYVSQTMIASETAEKCINWYIGQRNLFGYDSITTPGTIVPSFCTPPAGYSITTSVSTTTIPPDTTSNYKTIVVTVNYGEVLHTTMSLLIADY